MTNRVIIIGAVIYFACGAIFMGGMLLPRLVSICK